LNSPALNAIGEVAWIIHRAKAWNCCISRSESMNSLQGSGGFSIIGLYEELPGNPVARFLDSGAPRASNSLNRPNSPHHADFLDEPA
jgi:hypothetical protein